MKRLLVLVFVAPLLLLVSCASSNSKPALVESKGIEQDLFVSDTEIKEIEDIQNLPSASSDDLTQGEKVPMELNSLVTKWVKWFQGRGRTHMEKYLARSTRYLPMMKKTLRDRGLPEDLAYISLIESGFSPAAKSRVGAVGYWQFMRGTGKDYGLKITSHIDERRDPVYSTQAAADYFSGLYNLFGSWYLAIASYNAGENKIKHRVMKYHTRDFWDLITKGHLPEETVNYVPKFIAASLIAKEPTKYGFDNIDYHDALQFDEVKVEGTVSMRKLASLMKTNYEELRLLNPSFKTEYAMPARGTKFSLRVPKGSADEATRLIAEAGVRNTRVILAAAEQSEGPTVIRYRVKKGDSLTEVANHFRVSMVEVAKANRISPRSNLRVGQTLVIQKGGATVAKAESRGDRIQRVARELASQKIHVVRRGETLAAIARKYRVNMRELAMANNLKTRGRILVGDRIVIPD